jgi:uncharacterized membrane protein (GlpM family)
MQFAVKLIIAVLIIIICGQIAKVRPSLAGLIAVMPLTGLIIMLWVYSDCRGDSVKMTRYTLGAVWGIIPAILFFISAWLCFRKGLHLGWVLGISSFVWLVTAFLHQYYLHQE